MKVGFIGLGTMGYPMAHNLFKKGLNSGVEISNSFATFDARPRSLCISYGINCVARSRFNIFEALLSTCQLLAPPPLTTFTKNLRIDYVPN